MRKVFGLILVLGVGVWAWIRSSAEKRREIPQAQSSRASPQRPREVFELERADARRTELQGRLGEDDGFVAAIFFGGDIMGSLEVCGCPANPLGGAARRQGYVRVFASRYRDVPFLHVDTGSFLSDRVNVQTGDLPEDVHVGNRWVLRAYEQMGVDVVNVSYHDLLPLAHLLRIEEAGSDSPGVPMKARLLSANVVARAGGRAIFQSSLIREVAGGRLRERPVRIGFIGVTEAGNYRGSDFHIQDPLTAVRRVIPQLRKRVDLLVVLAYLPQSDVERVARENPDVDVILASVGRPLWLSPQTIGRTYIAYSVYQTKLLGELRLYRDERGGRLRVSARYIELDHLIPDDPAIEALRAEARREIATVQKQIAERARNAVRRAAGTDGVSFVGAGACRSCHPDAYAAWMASGHAHAFATLQKVKRENDPQCLGCHVTGYGRPGGFLTIFSTSRLADVQCEACHGPASRHLEDPGRPYGRVGVPEGCLPCHTRENSPDFEPLSYWAKIRH